MEPSYELIAHVISIVSPINFIVCIYVILVNSLVIWGYIRVENKTPVTFLFVALGMADISIAANYALRSVLSWFCLCGQELPTIATSVFLAAGLCSYNISNLLHVTLAVVKCVNIRFPIFQIRFERVKQVMIAAAVLWALLSAVDLALYLSFQNYGPLSSSCQHQWTLINDYDIIGAGLALYASREGIFSVTTHTIAQVVTVQYIVPCLIIMVAMVIQISSIRASQLESEAVSHITGTVIIISSLYLGSNGAYAVFTLLEVDISSHHTMRTAELVLKFTLPLLNCALYPMAIILRKESLRKRYLDAIRRLFRRETVWRKEQYSSVPAEDPDLKKKKSSLGSVYDNAFNHEPIDN